MTSMPFYLTLILQTKQWSWLIRWRNDYFMYARVRRECYVTTCGPWLMRTWARDTGARWCDCQTPPRGAPWRSPPHSCSYAPGPSRAPSRRSGIAPQTPRSPGGNGRNLCGHWSLVTLFISIKANQLELELPSIPIRCKSKTNLQRIYKKNVPLRGLQEATKRGELYNCIIILYKLFR